MRSKLLSLVKKYLIVFLVCILSGPNAFARNDLQVVVEDSAEIAARSYVDSIVSEYLENQIEDLLSEEALAANPDAASDLITFYNLTTGLSDYSKMQNGDAKTIKGANVIADSITLVNPAVGGAVKAVLFVVTIIAGSTQKSYQQKILELTNITIEEYTKLLEINQDLAKSEFERLSYLISFASIKLNELNHYDSLISKKCYLLENNNTDISQLDFCLVLANKRLSVKRQFIDLLSLTLNSPVNIIPINEILNALGYSADEIIKNFGYQLSQIQLAEKNLAEYGNRYIEQKIMALIDKNKSSLLMARMDSFEKKCVKRVREVIRENAFYNLNTFQSVDSTGSSFSKIRTPMIQQCLKHMDRFKINDFPVLIFAAEKLQKISPTTTPNSTKMRNAI